MKKLKAIYHIKLLGIIALASFLCWKYLPRAVENQSEGAYVNSSQANGELAPGAQPVNNSNDQNEVVALEKSAAQGGITTEPERKSYASTDTVEDDASNIAESAVTAKKLRRNFAKGAPAAVAELPEGMLKTKLLSLSPDKQEFALEWLQSFSFSGLDAANSLRADDQGGIYYFCAIRPDGSSVCSHDGCNQHTEHADLEEKEFGGPLSESSTFESTNFSDAAGEPEVSAAAIPVTTPIDSSLIFHSNPGSVNTIYLNFEGQTIEGTSWNNSRGVNSWQALPFSRDSDYSTYNDTEQSEIKRIWQRVAEDFAPFDVNVTTERPADWETNNRCATALITETTDGNGVALPHKGAGGIAYLGVFGGSRYASYFSPAFVTDMNTSNIAEAASHEVGHNLGLSHDGTSSREYYGGHGSGDVSWGPIMGTGYSRNVSQWSKGEYLDANEAQDDLVIIANDLNYRTDDHGNNSASATELFDTLGTISSTTPENDPENIFTENKGIIELNADVDVFSFFTLAGEVTLNANPWKGPSRTNGGNLDIVLELYDSEGFLITSSDPTNTTSASITSTLPQGEYYLHVKNTGVGDPFASSPTGYTSYGSIGQYFISGTIIDAGALIFDAAGYEITEDSGSATITVGRSGGTAGAVSIDYATADGTAVAGSDYNSTSGTLSWADGEGGSKSFNITIIDDNVTEVYEETLELRLFNPSGFEISETIFTELKIFDDEPFMRVNAPNGGERFNFNNSLNITWLSGLSGNVRIELLRNGINYLTIADTTENDGLFEWTVPVFVPDGSNYRIRITSLAGGGESDLSDGDFTVTSNIYTANMDSDPGWTLEGDWAYGVPQGNEGDPFSGNTGDSVIGYNLNGDYTNNLAKTHATTVAIDCSNSTNVVFSFYRWLGMESSTFDDASINVSNDGTNWTTIWSHSESSFTDGSWQYLTYDISAVADGQETVYIRWTMGETDSSVTYCGWNIDDVVVSSQNDSANPAGEVAFSSATYTVSEASTSATITLNRSGGSTGEVSVNYATSDGTATAGADYTPTSGTLTWADGDASAKTFSVSFNDDSIREDFLETIILTLTNTTGATIVGPNPATLNVEDDENTAPSVDAGEDQIAEWQTVTTTPGLYYGTVSGTGIDVTTPNPESQILVDVSSETEDGIATNTTEIYTGSIYDVDGQISFTEHIDDETRIWIDGALVLSDSAWRDRASTGNLDLAPGWHTIEIRIYNGTGGSGPQSTPGVGYDPAGGTNWQTLVDPGDGSFLRVNQDIAGSSVNLNGTVSDLDEDPVNTTWSMVSGPDSAIFGNASSIDTNVRFVAQGTYVLRLTADDGREQTLDEVVIIVGVPLTLTVDQASISENGGSTSATVTRLSSEGDLVVNLSSDDPSEATVPASVTILDGQASANFTITAQDDALVDAGQTVTITASSTGYPDATATLNVSDDEVATLTLNILADSIGESDGPGATTATVTRNSVTDNALLVDLSSDDTSEADVQSAVTIPAGQATSAAFAIDAIDDSTIDSTQTVNITAVAVGHTDSTDTLDVTDDSSITLTVVTGEGGDSTTGGGLNDPDGSFTIAATPAINYNFVNWTVTSGSASFDNEYAAETTVTASVDTTIQANFGLEIYTISYDGNGNDGGSAPSDQTKAFDTDLILSDAGTLTRTGYDFDGWNTAADGSGTAYVAGGTYSENADVTLYAKWDSGPAAIYEPFGQTAGSLNGQSGGAGLSGTWSINQTVNVVNPATMPYGDLPNAGGQVELPSNSGVDAWIATSSTLSDNNLLADGATLWFSLVYQKTTGSSSNEHSGFAFGTERIDGAFNGARMNTGYGVGFYTQAASISAATWNNGGQSTGGSLSITHSTPTLIVGKIEWGATSGDDETITLYMPSLTDLTNMGTGVSATVAGFDQTVLDTVSFTQRNSGGTQTYDEIRFGSTYESVIGQASSGSTYTVTYDGNGSDVGTVPVNSTDYEADATVTVLGNIGVLTKAGFTFSEWNTAADGSGMAYTENDIFAITEDVTLYAQWTANTPGYTLSKTSATVAENGGTDSFTVVLDSQPASSIAIDIRSSDINEATVSPTSLTFSSADWDSPQTVTITGVNDDAPGNDSATITASVNDASSDDAYDPLADQTVAVTCTNDDVANDFTNWMSGYDVGAQAGFTDDPDNDNLNNGVENYFGTHPGEFSVGLISVDVDKGAGTFTFSHPLNDSPASDISASYRWSKDLSAFHGHGEEDLSGTTVSFESGTASGGMVTVTATVTGTTTDKLFIVVEVIQN